MTILSITSKSQFKFKYNVVKDNILKYNSRLKKQYKLKTINSIFRTERSLSNEELFYDLASSTGGKIYITDKPSSSDDFLDFLEEEVTLGPFE